MVGGLWDVEYSSSTVCVWLAAPRSLSGCEWQPQQTRLFATQTNTHISSQYVHCLAIRFAGMVCCCPTAECMWRSKEFLSTHCHWEMHRNQSVLCWLMSSSHACGRAPVGGGPMTNAIPHGCLIYPTVTQHPISHPRHSAGEQAHVSQLDRTILSELLTITSFVYKHLFR